MESCIRRRIEIRLPRDGTMSEIHEQYISKGPAENNQDWSNPARQRPTRRACGYRRYGRVAASEDGFREGWQPNRYD